MKVSKRNIAFTMVLLFIFVLVLRYWGNITGMLMSFLTAAAPLILGCVIAYVVNILMSFYEKGYSKLIKNKNSEKPSRMEKLKRPLCMIAAFLSIFLIIAIVIGMVVPELIKAVTVLVYRVPNQIDALMGDVDASTSIGQEIIELYDTYIGSSAELQSMFEDIIETAKSGMIDGVKSVVTTLSSLFSGVVVVVVGVIFSIYILLDKEHLFQQIKRLMETYMSGISKKSFYVIGVINDCFHSFVVGQCTEAVILGTLCSISMAILRFPYAGMIGALIGFTALIPVAGAYIGGIVGALMMLTESPQTALFFLIFLVILQQLENNLIYPKVVGGSLGLSGIWVLAAVTVGGGVMGVIGMLIAVPLFAAIYRIVQADLKKREIAEIPDENAE